MNIAPAAIARRPLAKFSLSPAAHIEDGLGAAGVASPEERGAGGPTCRRGAILRRSFFSSPR